MMTDGRDIIRIAGYGRISAHKDALSSQKAALIQRFNAVILAHDVWLYSGVYIDAGTSHEQLDTLLNHCRDGSIDTIITPSINTLSLRRDELYRTLSELKDLEITVLFLDEELSTAGEGGDELLSTLASFLKPEKPKKPAALPYGIGDEDEATVVKRVFDMFLAGHGRTPIATQLNADGVLPPHLDVKRDYRAWTYCDIRRILDNPIYKEEGLIEEDTWERAVTETSRRNISYGRRPQTTSPLRGLITCGVCGNHYTRRERGWSSLWLCKTYLRGSRDACPSRGIRERVLIEILGQTAGETDNITVWPDGHLVINTSTGDFERIWR